MERQTESEKQRSLAYALWRDKFAFTLLVNFLMLVALIVMLVLL